MKETSIWIILLCLDGLIPLTALVGGIWFIKWAPRTKGGVGYCSKSALKSEETWRFAQSCCGIIWEMVGIATLVPSLMFGVISYFTNTLIQCVTTLILVAVQMIILWVATMSVDRSIKKHFDENGKPIQIESLKEEKEVAEEKDPTFKEILFGISDEEDEDRAEIE